MRVHYSALLCLLTGVAPVAGDPSSLGQGECGRFDFRDVGPDVGVEFVHQTGATGGKHLPETMGAGVSWLDFDGDGWLDLYLVQSGAFPPGSGVSEGNLLLRNLEGRCFEVVEDSGAEDRGYGQGSVAADFDGDGDLDIYVTNYGPDTLLLNQGQGRFDDGSNDAGLGLDGWSSSAALADADGDGDLDLYVSRYLIFDPEEEIFCGDPETGRREYCDPAMFRGAEDRFFRSQGDGRFFDTTEEAGIAPADGRGLGVRFSDLDGDFLPDIYVANDLTVNFLFANHGDGTFEDLSVLSGAAVNRDGRAEAGMGIALGDVDGDLDPDLFVTNFDVETNTLYRNQGGFFFADVSRASGLGIPSFNQLAFGVVAADFDGDGDLDMYVANGHIYERPLRENVRYRQPDQLFEGDGRGGFVPVPCTVLDERPTVARGLATGDFDNDGDLDLLVQENGGPARLLGNGGEPNGWLGLRLLGHAPNIYAVASHIVLETSAGRQVRWVTAGDSYQSSSDQRVHFGLGEAEILSLEIRWPDGGRSRLLKPPAGKFLVVPQRSAG